jgi:hypothetical protein
MIKQMHISTYLSAKEQTLYKEKADTLCMTEGELTQHLIHLFLNTPTNTSQSNNCLSCNYYHLATSQLITTLKQVADFFIVVQPQQKKK